MMELGFSFEVLPWEEYLDQLPRGGTASAATLLTLTQDQDGDVLEEALQALEERDIALDLSDLPKPGFTGEAAPRLRQEEQLAAKGLPVDQLQQGDPLRLYLEELALTPAFGDVNILAEDSRNGDEQARLRLTNLCLSRVVEQAKAHVGWGVLLLDLIQEGSMGLWQAISSWQEGNFTQYADRRIRFCIARAIVLQSSCAGVGQKLRTALEDYRSVDEKLLCDLGRNPTPEEIAEAMHISREYALSIGSMLENARALAQARGQPEPQEEELGETQAVEDTAYFQMRQRISDLLFSLNESDARLITLRYGLEGGLPLSPEDTGRQLGLTPDEVLTREAAALSKLRNVEQ